MLGAVRRGPALVQALRACAPRSILSVRATASLARWQRPSAPIAALQVRSFRLSATLRDAGSATAQEVEQAPENDGPITEFQQLADKGLVSPSLIFSITKKMNITTMTEVQCMTINETLKGVDVLAQAKTGTGKTLAFLLPVVQNILRQDSSLERRTRVPLRSNSSDIRAIIISPTRELAEQIAVEARKIVSSTGVIIQTAVGGTMKREGLRRIQREGCHILVGTPGRLKDILSDPTSGVKTPKLSSFVLDEADRLLDEGFAPDIAEIQSYLPDPMKVDRQTLMFSATVPREVMGMVRRTMKPNFKFVRTVKEDEVPTHLTVPQKLVFLRGLENALPAVLEIAKNYISRQQQDSSLRPFKAIVYFNCTADVQLAFEVFRDLHTDPADRYSGHPLGETRSYSIHSRLTQAQRTRSSDNFRMSRSAMLFSSDVTARGMDFPDVTHVIQVGSPRQRESYIHRLGRTARANKTGEGWILLHDEEYKDFRTKLGDLPIKKDTTSLQTAEISMGKPNQALPAPVAETLSQLGAAMKQASYESKAASYKAQISVLMPVFDSKRDVIRALNNLALNGWGLTEPPAMDMVFAGKLGLTRVAGVNLGDGEGLSDDAAKDRFSSSRGNRYERGSYDRSGGRRYSNDRSDRSDRSDRRERPGRRQFDRTDRYQRSDRSERFERHDRSDRRGRQDRQGRVEDNDL